MEKLMETKIDRQVLVDAINIFGDEAQINMAIEECSELINALAKYKRGRVDAMAVVTEIADVQIMAAQMELMFCCGGKQVEEERERKVERLRGLLEKHCQIAG